MNVISLLLALAALPIAAYLLWQYPVAVALTFVGAAVLSDVTGIGASGFSVGIAIYPLDLSCAALVAACIIVPIKNRRLPKDICVPALVLVGLGLLNFCRGALLFGVKAPGNDARDLINLVLPAAAFSLLSEGLTMNAQKLVAYLSLASLVLSVLAAARWAGLIATPETWDEEFREVVRVLASDYAIIIGQALIGISGIQLARGFRPIGFVLTALFAGLVFALQHRSVWIATIVGMAWLLLRSPRLARREWLQVTSLILMLAGAVAIMPLVASNTLEKAVSLLDSNVKEVNQENSTWAWRMDGYTEAIQRAFSHGVVEATIGPPSGRDLGDTASFASIHIHDRFIHTLAYYGIMGLIVLVSWLLSTAIRIHRFSSRASCERQASTDRAILEALMLSTVVYLLPYAGGQLAGLLLGAIWLASATPRADVGYTSPSVDVSQYRRPTLAVSRVATPYC